MSTRAHESEAALKEAKTATTCLLLLAQTSDSRIPRDVVAWLASEILDRLAILEMPPLDADLAALGHGDQNGNGRGRYS